MPPQAATTPQTFLPNWKHSLFLPFPGTYSPKPHSSPGALVTGLYSTPEGPCPFLGPGSQDDVISSKIFLEPVQKPKPSLPESCGGQTRVRRRCRLLRGLLAPGSVSQSLLNWVFILRLYQGDLLPGVILDGEHP